MLTEPERKLWHCLRDKRLEGMKFRRQQPIGPFVADFYCAAAKLIVEIDGSQHANEQTVYDEDRTKWLETRGYRVLRFWNSDLQDSDYILGAISHAIRQTDTAKRYPMRTRTLKGNVSALAPDSSRTSSR